MENFFYLEVMALRYKLLKIREMAWKDYGFHICWEAGFLVLTLGMFLYVLVWVLCIKMKNVVRTGLELPSAYLQVSILTTGGI